MTSGPMTTAQLREAFLAFFAAKGCVRYPSAPLVTDDPTTLFTVAGMSQFKDMFLGRGSHPFTKATTCQKCMRTNDILNVGRTPRHHTFFEMLGNFSFNDYFKRETIAWAWEFLTQVVKLDRERLSVSVHRIDDEAYDIWAKEIGIPTSRIFRLDDKDNFWPANAPVEGPLGPGGCCSEIFWDFRTNDDPRDNLAGDSGRFVEVWNCVFPQFNVSEPKVDGRYTLQPLGRTNIDTGMGLERLACVVQGKRNNFDNDLFSRIIAAVSTATGRTYVAEAPAGSPEAEANVGLRRIADHVRGVTFAIADGAPPSNKGAGYVVRRLVRRAVLDADRLGVEDPILAAVVPAVVAAMGEAYPEVVRKQDQVKAVLQEEELQFRRTLRRGLELLHRELDDAGAAAAGRFDGEKAFRLYETYGFPREVTAEILAERKLAIDDAAWKRAEEAHRDKSRSKGVEVFTVSALADAKPRLGATPFVGYQNLSCDTELTLLEVAGASVASAPTGATVRFALARTPFYAESGGQAADRGTVAGRGPDGAPFVIRVADVQKDEGLVVHEGVVEGGCARPGPVRAEVDAEARAATARHHSATHLLHAALGGILGGHVEQQGSKVDAGELRFDFNHPQQPSRDELAQVERWVNDQVILGHRVTVREMPIAEARAAGAKALFGEKYGEVVRMVQVGVPAVSTELCGGTHVESVGDIGSFRIVREEAVSAGTRRIIAVAGAVARALADEEDRIALACGRLLGMADPEGAEVGELARELKATGDELVARVRALVEEAQGLEAKVRSTEVTQLMPQGGLVARVRSLQTHVKRLRKEIERANAAGALAQVDALLAKRSVAGGVPLVAAELPGVDAKALKEVAEAVLAGLGSGCVVLASNCGGKALLQVLVSKDRAGKPSAGAVIAPLAKLVGGGGGGKAEQAQAGGRLGEQVGAAIAAAPGAVAAAAGG